MGLHENRCLPFLQAIVWGICLQLGPKLLFEDKCSQLGIDVHNKLNSIHVLIGRYL